MDTTPPPPPPPPLFFTTDTVTPQIYYNGGPPTNNVSNYHRSSSPATSAIIIIIIIASAIIISAIIYLLIRFFSRRYNPNLFRFNNDVVSENINLNDHVHHHVISIDQNNNNNINNNALDLLPLFTFSSVTGKNSGGDCSVCLSKFEDADQLRLLPFCCHAFHAQCVDTWLKSNHTCPLCRSPVNPSEADVMKKIGSGGGGGVTGVSGDRSNSFRIEIGTVSQRRDPSESERRSYSVGSFDYVVEDNYEIPVESTEQRAGSDRNSVDKDSVTEPPVQNLTAEVGGSGRNWLLDYVDRVSVTLSSRSISFRGGSGRLFTGSSRRSETVDDFEASQNRIGEEISEFFRWLSGV